MTDLQSEIESGFCNISSNHLDRLNRLGVSNKALSGLNGIQPSFGITRCQDLGEAIYQPDDLGLLHMLIGVFDRGLVDIVAFQTSNPSRWLWRIGHGWALGLDNLRPRWDDGPVTIVQTPLEWLASNGKAMCILDWDAPDYEIDRLRLCDQFVTGNEMLAARVDNLFSKPCRKPEIKVIKEEQHAA